MDDLDPTASLGGVWTSWAAREVGFRRRLLLSGLILVLIELALVGAPLWFLFDLSEIAPATLARIAIPVVIGVSVIWVAVTSAWFAPLQRLLRARRRGERLPSAALQVAYRAALLTTWRLCVLRTLLWTLAAAGVGVFLARYDDFTTLQVVEMASVAFLQAWAASILRAVLQGAILATLRLHLFPERTWLERFADGYQGRLLLVAAAVFGVALAALSGFMHFFLPISVEQYLQVQIYVPPAAIIGLLSWRQISRYLTRDIRAYISAASRSGSAPSKPNPDRPAATATAVYRLAQSLPYRLAVVSVLIWSALVAGGALIGRYGLRIEQDDTILMVGVGVVMSIGAAIYESLWHRETMRIFLAHLTVHHQLPVRELVSLSLRTKLVLSFGGLVLFACAMALFWGFAQYKNLVTDFVSRQAGLSLAWLRSEVNAAAARTGAEPTSSLVETVIESVDRRSIEANAIFYYLPADHGAELTSVGGGPLGAPVLPWYIGGLLRLPRGVDLDIDSMALSGRTGRLKVRWRDRGYDLGSVAVLYPNYRGRGESVVRPLKELWLFFLALFGACTGIVLLTVGQFVKPIRRLERRADAMARGELAEPVSSGGESDEIGRLSFALEEMRRALREKLRSTEEINLELDRAVQRRTADLAKKNRELAETLDKLTRAQEKLVRAEKMASIGQLVAGIAHEINNPVNAMVNTVGPLEEAVDVLMNDPDPGQKSEAAGDVRDMIRVVQRGAERTKAIVRALHNYSRTDDEQQVVFDLNRSIDDSLALLRHLLKQHIRVERDYAEVGRIRGHAGQLNQVFMNLLTNAAQALSGRDGACIRIETRADDTHVSIRIIDNGEGISPEVLPRIFDPFFTTKDVGEGTGLGLSIVHGLVERHGGTIEVESEPGVRTVFAVTLPRHPEASAVSLPRAAPAPATPGASSPTPHAPPRSSSSRPISDERPAPERRLPEPPVEAEP